MMDSTERDTFAKILRRTLKESSEFSDLGEDYQKQIRKSINTFQEEGYYAIPRHLRNDFDWLVRETLY